MNLDSCCDGCCDQGTEGHEDGGEEGIHVAGQAQPDCDDVVKYRDNEDGGDEVFPPHRSVDELAEGVEAAAGENEVGLALDGSNPGGGGSAGAGGAEGETVVSSVTDEEGFGTSAFRYEAGFFFRRQAGVDVFGGDAEFVCGFADPEKVGVAAEDAEVESMPPEAVHLIDGSVANGFVDVEGGYVLAVF